jgi:hypothetical protein
VDLKLFSSTNQLSTTLIFLNPDRLKMAPERREVTRAWEALTPPLSEWIVDAVSSMGFEKMTPVQANCIPLFLGNKDVVVEVCVTELTLRLSSLLILYSRQSLVTKSNST